MRDETIEALDGLATEQATPQSSEVTAEIANIRHAIETLGPRPGAEITTMRGLLLLFDVLIGITIGTLAHDQDQWARKNAATACGTVRCVAGWLAQIGYPGSRPDFYAGQATTAQQMLPDGTSWSMQTLSIALLTGVEPIRVYAVPASDTTIAEMFAGGATLEGVWNAATRASGGIVTLPESLVDHVRDLDEDRLGAEESGDWA